MLGIKEAQAMLGVSKGHIYNLVSSGAIAHYRFGKHAIRFEEAQLLAYKESCAVAARVPRVPIEIKVSRVNVSSTGEKSELEEYFEMRKLIRKDKPKV